jgi:hypothetical protein
MTQITTDGRVKMAGDEPSVRDSGHTTRLPRITLMTDALTDNEQIFLNKKFEDDERTKTTMRLVVRKNSCIC